MSVKNIFSLFLLLLILMGAYFSSVIVHEMLHVMLDMPNDIEKAMCINLNPYYRSETNQTIVAWVQQTDMEVSYTEDHYGIYFIQGIAFMLFITVGMFLLFNMVVSKPPCYGSKQFNHFNKICKGCDDYRNCEREYDKKNGLT